MQKLLLTILLSVLTTMLFAQPKLVVKEGKTTSGATSTYAHIIANDKPMLIIGGELGNSSASTRDDVERIFPHLKRLNLNTVLAPVTWELLEPQEGSYDFTSLDDIISAARKNDLKVVLLWFGAWKNSMSCYTPEWFKRDTKRFPRAHTKDGKAVGEASSLSKNVLEADKRVFCKMMEHIRSIDMAHQTVIMIQVENEIGMIESPRDYSEDATKIYKKEWAARYGDTPEVEERFQAWTYATYVEQIARAGKAIYNLPMYVNVALNSRNRRPGEYPSGGPLAHLADIWKQNAPSIDVMGLDLYDQGYRSWTQKYHFKGNPLFIPEIRLEDQDGVRSLYAFGHHSALGFCPFSIEDYPLTKSSGSNDWQGIDLSADDQLNAFSSHANTLSPLASSYRLLRQIEPLILRHQGTQDIEGVLLDNALRDTTITFPADGISMTVKQSYSLGWEPGARNAEWPEVGCIIIRQGPQDYVVLGTGIVITFSSPKKRIGLAKCEQIEYDDDGTLRILRHLSGDQTHQGRHVRISTGDWQIQHFRLYDY